MGGLQIALHSQTLQEKSGIVSGSEITTNGLEKAFLKLKEVYRVFRFSPSNVHFPEDAAFDLVIIEGWHATLHQFIANIRKHSCKAKILFWNLSFYGFNDLVKLDLDGFLTNSRRLSAVLAKLKPTEFVMLAANTDQFKPVTAHHPYQHDVVYLGMYHPHKSDKTQEQIIKAAVEFDLAIYGSDWQLHPILGAFWRGKLPLTDIPKLYSSAKVVLGTSEDRQRAVGMINNRVFEALACGACFVSEFSSELQYQFGDSVFLSNSKTDTQSIIKDLVINYDSYTEHRKRVRQLIVDKHTYDHRVRQILDFYQSLQL